MTAFEFLYASIADPDLSWQAKVTKSISFLTYTNEAGLYPWLLKITLTRCRKYTIDMIDMKWPLFYVTPVQSNLFLWTEAIVEFQKIYIY